MPSITLPGVRVLDEIMMGLPTNSAQRLEITKLKAEIEKLQAKCEKLEQEKALNAPKPDMPVEAAKILQFLFNQDYAFSAEELADTHEWDLGMAKHYCDILSEKKLVDVRRRAGMGRPSFVQYAINAAGRAYVVEKGLIPNVS